MAIRWAYRDHYDHFPKYLQRAAELLSKKHYLYQSIKAKEYYFRGLTMRLEAIGKSNEKELMSAALDTQRVALIYENQAAFIYNEIGVIHSELEQWDSSVYYFNIATEWAPRWSIPWSNLCLVYTEMGNYEKAIECGNEAIKVEPRYVTAYNHMGIVYLDMKDYRTAESYFRKAIEKDETYPISYYNLSCTKALRGQRQASLKWLEMAIKWGYNDFELMEKDQDLDNVRGMKRFENLVESLSSDKNRD
jgi:tetratricopeptide (TPR) repeat protein